MRDGTEMLPLSCPERQASTFSKSASVLASSTSKAIKSTSAVLERTSRHSEGGLLQVINSLLVFKLVSKKTLHELIKVEGEPNIDR